jgi:alpha-L-rhamnosidase
MHIVSIKKNAMQRRMWMWITAFVMLMVTLPIAATVTVTDMKVLNLRESLGIDKAPTFSWRTESDTRGFHQSGYEITVCTEDGTSVWKSGHVASALQNNIPYSGTALRSRTRYIWTVKVYGADGSVSNDASSTFETAFMNPSEWTAKWIYAAEKTKAVCEIKPNNPVTLRYLKIDVTKLGLKASTDPNYYYMQLSEVEIYSGGVNVAGKATVAASDQWSPNTSWSLNYINDGIIASSSNLGYTTHTFTSAAQHVYLTFDLGTEQTVDRIMLYPRQDDCASTGNEAANFPATFTLQSSTDGKEYVPFYTATDMAAPSYEGTTPRARYEVQLDAPVDCQYVKIDATKLGLKASSDQGFYYMQLAEVELYNGSTNEARTASVTASNNWSPTTAWALSHINDGVIVSSSNLGYTTSTFTSNNQHVYITFNLGSKKTIDRIVLYPRQDDCAIPPNSAANFPSSFTIQTSDDNATYITRYTANDVAAPEYSTHTGDVPYYALNFKIPQNKQISRARIYATALGVFTMRLNGKYVTENKLEPGETNYDKAVQYATYDVTSLITPGENALLAQVAGGIFNVTPVAGRYSKKEIRNAGESALKATLYVEYTDGTHDEIGTDGSWHTNSSATTGSNWWGGEDFDARKMIDGVENASFDFSAWDHAKEVVPSFTSSLAHPNTTNYHANVGVLRARCYEPLRVVESWKAVGVKQIANGHYVVDFGRNFAGQYKFTLKGKPGQTILIRDGEALNADGTCLVENNYSNVNDMYDLYTFRGSEAGESWGPEFMYHGFRYLEISGLEDAPSADSFTAFRIRSNMEQNGNIMTSNSLLNSIHTICRDAIQSNLYNTATDCPQREKLGWLDDANEMYNSISLNYDMNAFWHKVVSDCFDGQYSDGHVPSTCPHFMNVYDDDPNWGGAAILVPYRSYRMYGDRSLMETYYPQMKRLMDYYTSISSGYIMPGSKYSVLSDWGQGSCGLVHQVPGEFTITTTYYYLLKAMAEMAEQMGYAADSIKYTDLAQHVKTAFNNKFYDNSTGVYEYGNQSEYGMPLYYGLVDSANVSNIAAKLASKVKADNYRIKTGEIGLKPVLMSLTQNGYNDIVYKMANQTDYPSYGYFVKMGCTTTPEYWDMSFSQNHCMMDHIEEWFFSELGGIKNAGIAYDHILIKPWIPTDMKHLEVTVKSVYGSIASSYNKGNDSICTYTFTIPCNTSATIVLPMKSGMKLAENGSEIEIGSGVDSVIYTDSLATVVVGSGTYHFSTLKVPSPSAVHTTTALSPTSVADVYSLSGQWMGRTNRSDLRYRLARGLYISQRKKIVVE